MRDKGAEARARAGWTRLTSGRPASFKVDQAIKAILESGDTSKKNVLKVLATFGNPCKYRNAHQRIKALRESSAMQSRLINSMAYDQAQKCHLASSAARRLARRGGTTPVAEILPVAHVTAVHTKPKPRQPCRAGKRPRSTRLQVRPPARAPARPPRSPPAAAAAASG